MAALYATFIVLVCAVMDETTAENPLSDEFINRINSKHSSWTAGRNFPLHSSIKNIKKLMGTLKDDSSVKLPKLRVGHDSKLIAVLPKKFDPTEKWPNCPTLNEIRDQGSCGSCWAFAAVEAMTDRYCIHSNETKQFHFSADDLISCCETCGLGCIRGVHTAAWKYWNRVGLVSGGNYNSSQGCKPYKIPPLGSVVSPVREIVDISDCITSCDSSDSIDYHKDKRHGKKVYSIDSKEEQIKAELFVNGPVQGVMAVYTDFLNYKYGVYVHTEGHFLGHHSVKILGWGEESGHKYWHAANSWNQNWGDKGFFKILRGVNHCDIEDSIVAGEPIIV